MGNLGARAFLIPVLGVEVDRTLFTGDFERQRIFTHSIYTFIPKSNLGVDGKAQLEIVVFLNWLHGGGKYFPNYA